jgi:hypothetical protein
MSRQADPRNPSLGGRVKSENDYRAGSRSGDGFRPPLPNTIWERWIAWARRRPWRPPPGFEGYSDVNEATIALVLSAGKWLALLGLMWQLAGSRRAGEYFRRAPTDDSRDAG